MQLRKTPSRASGARRARAFPTQKPIEGSSKEARGGLVDDVDIRLPSYNVEVVDNRGAPGQFTLVVYLDILREDLVRDLSVENNRHRYAVGAFGGIDPPDPLVILADLPVHRDEEFGLLRPHRFNLPVLTLANHRVSHANLPTDHRRRHSGL